MRISKRAPARLSRRLALRAAGGAAALAGAAAITGDQRGQRAEAYGEFLEGSWIFTVSITGLPPEVPSTYKSHLTFIPGGGLVQMAWSARPLALVSVGPWFGHGEWANIGHHQFALTVAYPRFDADGVLIGSGKGRGRIQVNDTGDAAGGQFQVDLIDTNGDVVLSGTGTVQATRMQVEPLD